MPFSAPGVSLTLKSVSRSFNPLEPILNNISLTLSQGEFVCFLGPSGCGKSTLLRLMAGLDLPDQGSLHFEPAIETVTRSFVFQEPRLLPWLNVLDNVLLPITLGQTQTLSPPTLGKLNVRNNDHHPSNLSIATKPVQSRTNKEIAKERATQILEQVGLSQAWKKFPWQLSGGMKMRASIARALITRPSLLLLDEPFSALDEYTRQSLQEDLYQLWKTFKMTTIFVTHSLSEALFLSERVLVMSRSPSRILKDHRVLLEKSLNSDFRHSTAFLEEIRSLSEALLVATS